jgi:hypothetical protein
MYWKHLFREPDGEGKATYLRHLSHAKKSKQMKRTRNQLEAAISQSQESVTKKKQRGML